MVVVKRDRPGHRRQPDLISKLLTNRQDDPGDILDAADDSSSQLVFFTEPASLRIRLATHVLGLWRMQLEPSGGTLAQQVAYMLLCRILTLGLKSASNTCGIMSVKSISISIFSNPNLRPQLQENLDSFAIPQNPKT